MAFVRTETWVASPPEAEALRLPAWMSGRWTSRGLALVLSLALDAAVIAVLLHMGDFAPRIAQREAESIATVDMSSHISQATSSAASAAAVSASAGPPTKIDATTAPPVPKEWAVTTLPPVPTPQPSPAPPAPPALTPTNSTGSGSVGNATGTGYDPYAYASYRPPSQAAGAVSVPPDALTRLEEVLRQRVAATGSQIAAQVVIDNQGRIIRFLAGPSLSPSIAAAVSDAVIGFALCAPDPRRPPASTVAINLSV